MSYDPNLSSTMIRKPQIDVQNEETEKRLNHKKKLEDKIMDNILRLNLVFFIMCLIIIGFFFMFDFEIVYRVTENNEGMNK